MDVQQARVKLHSHFRHCYFPLAPYKAAICILMMLHLIHLLNPFDTHTHTTHSCPFTVQKMARIIHPRKTKQKKGIYFPWIQQQKENEMCHQNH